MIFLLQFGFGQFTTEITEPKLQKKDHWNVLYKVCVFYVDRKSKMAATAIHRLTLDPMEKMFKCLLRNYKYY
jgi:hypothetical protein